MDEHGGDFLLKTMKRIILSILLSSLLTSVIAQVDYDFTIVDKKREVRGAQSFQKDDNEIFANAFLWAVGEGPGQKLEIIDYDFNKRQLAMVYNLKKEDKVAYSCRLELKVAQGQLVFAISDIKIIGGILGAFGNFNKLDPEKKPKHRDILNEFQRLNNQKLDELFTFVVEHQPVITNWRNVCTGRIDRGMSVDEAMLIYGKPEGEQNDGTKTQYRFSTFVYVFVENGVVTSYVN